MLVYYEDVRNETILVILKLINHNRTQSCTRSDQESNKIVEQIRQRAVTTLERPRKIMQQSTAAAFLRIASFLPDYTASQRRIQHQRQRHVVPYGPVSSTADIVFPDSLQHTLRNKEFFL